MRKRLMAYRRRIDALLDGSAAAPALDGEAATFNCDGDASAPDWDDVIEEHLTQIAFFQHERLVHLMVTLAFACMELGSVMAAVLAPHPLTAALALLLLVLLVPYIVHYYFLENETQKLYAQYDRMLARRASDRRSGRALEAPRGPWRKPSAATDQASLQARPGNPESLDKEERG